MFDFEERRIINIYSLNQFL